VGEAEVQCPPGYTYAKDLGRRTSENCGCSACAVGETEEGRVVDKRYSVRNWPRLAFPKQLSGVSPFCGAFLTVPNHYGAAPN
jgi:hypothetical protein